MTLQVKSNLKNLLDSRKMSIRQLEKDTGLQFETLRRLYHDDSKQYHKDTIARICEVLHIEINELLILDKKDGTE